MPGLRERRRARTRQELVDAALTLFEEQGFDETTIEEVAAAAEVSPRTVFRHFATKEDLVFFNQEEENRKLATLVNGAPKGADPITTLMDAARSILLEPGVTPEQLVRSHRLVERVPSLSTYKRALLRKVEALLAGALAPSRATRPELLRARLLAGVYLVALDVTLSSWIEGGAKGAPTAELESIEALLRRAFPATERKATRSSGSAKAPT